MRTLAVTSPLFTRARSFWVNSMRGLESVAHVHKIHFATSVLSLSVANVGPKSAYVDLRILITASTKASSVRLLLGR